MANKSNPNIISEEDFLRDLESGKITELEKETIVAGAHSGPPMSPPSLPPQVIPNLSGSLPPSMTGPHGARSTYPYYVPSVRGCQRNKENFRYG